MNNLQDSRQKNTRNDVNRPQTEPYKVPQEVPNRTPEEAPDITPHKQPAKNPGTGPVPNEIDPPVREEDMCPKNALRRIPQASKREQALVKFDTGFPF